MTAKLNIALVGPGLVGSELLSQLSKSSKFNVIAIANSKQMTFSSDWAGSKKTSIDYKALVSHCVASKPCVVVDCTSNEAVAGMYVGWLENGLHVVTPNKKAFSGDLSLYKSIQSKTSEAGPFIFHEATVGAGLPLLSTLSDLVATGDKIYKIEGIFSGTLSFIFNTFSAEDCKMSFSEIVAMAKKSGFTEPDPRDDLNGVDVARKVCILGRLSKMSVLPTLQSCNTENIVPIPLRSLNTAEFMDALPQYDAHFTSLKNKAAAEGCVLRYVGVVDVKGGTCSVTLKSYPKSHPFASLKGSDNIVSFSTERFSPNPLIIQGAGAGAAVTAFGIHSDLLKVAARI